MSEGSGNMSKRSKLMRNGLISLSLATCLAACQTTRSVVIQPDAALLADCPRTAVALAVNADLGRAVLQGREDLDACNVDKRALRAFYDGVNKALSQ